MVVNALHSDKARERRAHVAIVLLGGGASCLAAISAESCVADARLCFPVPRGRRLVWAAQTLLGSTASETLPRRSSARQSAWSMQWGEPGWLFRPLGGRHAGKANRQFWAALMHACGRAAARWVMAFLLYPVRPNHSRKVQCRRAHSTSSLGGSSCRSAVEVF